MRRHLDVAQVQHEGCLLLLNIGTLSSNLWPQFVPFGGPQLLVDVIDAHHDSADVIAAASHCLRAMLPTDDTFEGWDALRRSVAADADDADADGEDFAVVARVTQDLLNGAAPALLLSNLRTFCTDNAVCGHLFAILGFLVQVYNHDVDAWGGDFDAAPLRQAIVVALDAIKEHPTRLALHEAALFYLSRACSAGPSVGTSLPDSLQEFLMEGTSGSP